MRLNSEEALQTARRVFERFGGDWAKVREAGKMGEDGVIDLSVREESHKTESAKEGVEQRKTA